MKKKKFYLSTALPYVNAVPHIGHALEFIQADVLARYLRLSGGDVFFLSGADENSLKNVQAAKKEGISTRELVDKNSKRFYELKGALNLSFDDFIKTTEERHVKGSQKLWLACKKDIYKKKYKGLYCVGCEEFYKEDELANGLCPEHKTKPELIEEENYFFKLSRYQDKLKELIKKDKIKIFPEARKNETLSFIERGLEDICISRSSKRAYGWGIEVPDDSSQCLWVWFDALSNYINALGYAGDSKKFLDWWQKNKNKLHILGKGILRFHAIYWPAMLLSAGLVLPEKIFVHGYLTSNGQKMSKSLGNVVDPFELIKKYGADVVRYFLLREIPSAGDGDFTFERLEDRYNSDLAKGLGNLVARVITLAGKFKVVNPKPGLKKETDNAEKKYKKALDEFKFNEALVAIWGLISFCDKYIEKEKPWQERTGQKEAIANLLFVVGKISGMLRPFLPETSERIQKQLKSKKSEILFPKIDAD